VDRREKLGKYKAEPESENSITSSRGTSDPRLSESSMRKVKGYLSERSRKLNLEKRPRTKSGCKQSPKNSREDAQKRRKKVSLLVIGRGKKTAPVPG